MWCSKAISNFTCVALLMQMSGCSRVDSVALVDPSLAEVSAVEIRYPVASGSVEEGSPLKVSVGEGVVSVHAQQVPLDTVLEELSKRLPFKLTYASSSVPSVSVAVDDVNIPQLLNVIGDGVGYNAEYAPQRTLEGFRIMSLVIGVVPEDLPQKNAIAAAYEPASAPAPHALAIDDVFVGNSDFEKQLAQRLVDADPRQRAIAVRDLRATPTEFAVAEKMFRNDTAPEVAIAALQLAESEDLFAANKMIVDALEHADPAPVLYALDIIDRRLDYSLMPRLEQLQSSPHTSVQQKSLEVWESLRDTYALRP